MKKAFIQFIWKNKKLKVIPRAGSMPRYGEEILERTKGRVYVPKVPK